MESQNPQRSRARSPLARAALLLGAVSFALTAFAGSAAGGAGKVKVRWDIVSIAGGNVSAGGTASALANDGSKITITSSGTFRSHHGKLTKAKGGGTWETRNPGGAVTGGGTYEVVDAVAWVKAPGEPPPLGDLIGDPDERSAGLAHLLIEYSDGSSGVLIVSCRLVGTPTAVFEGINASKGFVDYTHNIEPVAGVDENRTLFHVSD